MSNKMGEASKWKRISGILIFVISFIVYFFSVERTGSLWDCGEFVLAAYKLQVVHPPGAPLFLIVGRMFGALGDTFSDNPSNIAFAINLMSGICSAFAAMFVGLSAFIFGKLALIGREQTPNQEQSLVLSFVALGAGLATAFCTSIWFSAVEGEVYAMSTFFTAMTFWAMVEWYHMEDSHQADRWVLFALFSAGMSVGVHLLSLLTFPAITLMYYFKKWEKPTWLGALISFVIGAGLIIFVQKVIISGIPAVWLTMDKFMVNSLGMPFHTGLIPTILLLLATLFFGHRYVTRNDRTSFWIMAVLFNIFLYLGPGLKYGLLLTLGLVVLYFRGSDVFKKPYVRPLVEKFVAGTLLLSIGFSVIGVVLVRSNAHPPINMNAPTDASRLLPYINREQYGERPIFYGPQFNARPTSYEYEDRYGRVGDRYEVVEQKISANYKSKDKMLFPRLSHTDQARKSLYKNMWGISENPTMAENIGFFLKYQVGWMYWRYLMWNFSGRQNGNQGYTQANVADGNWVSGYKFFDDARLHNTDKMPDSMRANKAHNKYYMLPFIFGLIGLIWQYRRDKKDFAVLLTLFLISGLGIIIQSNEPPNEPRERDYVLIGSFFTYAMWIGMGALGIYSLLKEKFNLKGMLPAALAGLIIMIAPVLMGTQNFDDVGRSGITAARDYATNFLTPLEPNAIIFTYGDNDTYPLWYAQEVEGVRTDVRIINLSLIGVDWYVNHQRRKLNESNGVKYTISERAYIGDARNQNFFYDPQKTNRPYTLDQTLKFLGEKHQLQGDGRAIESYIRSKNIYLPVNRERALSSGWVKPSDANKIVDKIQFGFKNKSFLMKGDVAVMDIINSNIYDRPIYISTTVPPTYFMGIEDYLQLEGIAYKIVPIKTPSDRSLGQFGFGRNNLAKNHKAYTELFKWGNFDKEDLFVDDSYAAAIQSMRLAMLRTATDLAESGQKEKAAEVASKYFDAFPHMNFPYKPISMPFISVLIDSGKEEEAKEHMRIMINEATQFVDFYQSLGKEDQRASAGFRNDFAQWSRGIQEMRIILNRFKDKEFSKEMSDMLAPYIQQPTL